VITILISVAPRLNKKKKIKITKGDLLKALIIQKTKYSVKNTIGNYKI
jgi:hypothetical protein